MTRYVQSAHAHPVRTGVFAVLGVIMLGSLAGFALGFGNPISAAAQVIIVTAPPPPPPPPPIVTSPAPLPPPPVTAPAPTQSGGSTGTSDSGSETSDNSDDPIVIDGGGSTPTPPPTTVTTAPTPRDPIIVTGTQPRASRTPPDHLSPCCTQSTPPTPPAIDTLPPCCTVVTPPAPPPTDILPPCCTVPTPPVVPPVVSPPPPVIPPPVIPPPTPTPTPTSCISLSADKTLISPGEAVTLTWAANTQPVTVTDVTHSATVTTSANKTGTVIVHPTSNTTYHASVSTDLNNPHCTVAVKIVTTPPPQSACIALSADKTTISSGEAVTLTWRVQNDKPVTVTDVTHAAVVSTSNDATGTVVVHPTGNTTYHASVPSDLNNPHCTVAVKVTTPPPPGACIALTADKTSITPGEAVTLTWSTSDNPVTVTDTTHNTTVTTSNNQTGSITVHPTSQTTYHASVPHDLNNPHCTVTVKIKSPPPPSACIALTADKTTITSGEAVTLSWDVDNDHPVTITDTTHNTTVTTSNDESGTVIVHPTSQTTYHASVPSDTDNPDCTTTVKIVASTPGSCVYLNASDQDIDKGQDVTLTWKVNNVKPVTITDNHGHTIITTNDQTGSTTVNPTEDTTYHASVPGDENNENCTASVNINTGGGGGHHHHGGSSSHVFISSETRSTPPLASVYLSQIPYTGLDLGPVGTVLYWAMLVLWSLAAAYLILFGLLPFLKRKFAAFGASVSEALNSEPAGLLPAYAGAMPMASIPAAARSYGPSPAQAGIMERSAPAPRPAPRLEMTGEGFKKFATGGALTIDDIVKGLSRESGMEISTEPTPEPHAAPYAPVHQDAAPAAIERPVPPPAPAPRPAAAPRKEQAAVETHPDVVAFISHILEGEKDAVFATIRRMTQAGHDAEAFVSHAILALDDAYKARLEGTPVHEDVKAVTDHCATSFLEKLVSALTTAVDGSYSMGVTGIKLALTRALAVAQG